MTKTADANVQGKGRLMMAGILALALTAPSLAQTTPAAPVPAPVTPATPPAVPVPAPSAPATPPVAPAAPPVAPVVPAIPPAAPAQAPAPAAPPAVADPKPSGDASTAQVIQLEARPAAFVRGSATWDDGFTSLTAAFAKIRGEVDKAGLKVNGRPVTIFVETDDDGFRYEAMIPLVEAPAGKDSLSADVKIGKTPPGKAIKFQHRGPYEEIDSTYEAITAYLDEKGLEAQNLFIEEYLTDPKAPDDVTLEVDIYVFVQ